MKTNQQLKDAHLPHCDWRTFLTYKEPPSSEEVAALDAHFQHFVPPGVCIKCGSQQGVHDLMEAALGVGKFVYGIQHGEGHCSKCGWPARALHYNIGPIKRLEMVIQYHPDVCSWD